MIVPDGGRDALKALLRNVATALEAPNDPDLAGSKSAVPGPDFTNQGKTEVPETPVKQGPGRIKRVPFVVSRLMEFCSRDELINQTGHECEVWPLVVLKELIDNALDAAEESEIAPTINIDVNVKRGTIIITDNGPGIPAKTIASVLDYKIRVSSREAYASPTRGQQGNALKTILPMAYVLDDSGDHACGKTIIEAHGIAHHISFEVDHIRQEPKISLITKPSTVVKGTRITVTLPKLHYGDGYTYDTIAQCERRFLELAESYAWVNPHLTLKVRWSGKIHVNIKASKSQLEKMAAVMADVSALV